MRSMAIRRLRLCAMASLWQQQRRSVSAASSIGLAFRPRRSRIACAKPAFHYPTSSILRSIRTAGPICSGNSPIWRVNARISRLSRSGLKNRRARQGILGLLAANFPGERFRGELHRIEHHLAHLSSAFHVSPFNEAVVVSVDGFGDFSSAAWGAGKGTEISVDGRVYFPHSLGIFYQALTQYLGFPHYGDEYKVMGLAPYGSPIFVGAMRKIVRLKVDGSYSLDLAYFRHYKERTSYQWAEGSPKFDDLFTPALEELLGPRRSPDDPLDERHRDVACSVQAMYEEAFFHLIGRLHERYRLDNLTLAGGCAMNSVANGKVRRMTPFRRVYVQSAAGDAGGAIGSAFSLWHALGGARSFVMDHAYWGPQYHSDEIEALLAARQSEIDRAGCTVERITGRGGVVPTRGCRNRRRQGGRLVPGSHGMGPPGTR